MGCVLIVKLAAIGDVVMALPLVTALRARDPTIQIDWMGGRQVAPLLRAVDGIRNVIAVDEAALLTGSRVRQAQAVLGAWRGVAGRRYDAVLVAHSDARYGALTWPVRTNERRLLGEGSGRRGIDPRRLHTDEYLELVGPPDDTSPAPYPPPPVHVTLAHDLAAALEAANPRGLPLVAMTPGGARNVARENPLRRWPLERYAALAQRLHEAGCRVVLTGDARDGWTRSAFRSEHVVDLVGRTDLPQLVALFRRCAAVVAHDSGPMHLARLSGTPVVALLGPTPPTMFFRPSERALVLWPGKALPCSPCYDGLDFPPCSSNLCMQMIDVDTVAERVDGIVGTASGVSV